MFRRIAMFGIAGILGVGVGLYSALAMSGLLPGDRRIGDGIEINGWVGDLRQGSVDASPYLRARIARHGLLAMAKSEAIYFIRARDDAGEHLTEDCDYKISGGALPAGWWSVTLYNTENFLPDNMDEALSFNSNLSSEDAWSAIISPTQPDDGANWISSHNAGKFDLTLRLYMPASDALAHPQETIAAPTVERLECKEQAS